MDTLKTPDVKEPLNRREKFAKRARVPVYVNPLNLMP
jgi:hypothetical protein